MIFLLAFVRELVVEAPGGQRLAQGEQLLRLQIAPQRGRDRGHALLAAGVAVQGERLRITFAGHHGIENGQPRLAVERDNRGVRLVKSAVRFATTSELELYVRRTARAKQRCTPSARSLVTAM